MTKKLFLKHSIALVSMVITVCCLFIVTVAVLKLPEVSTKNREMRFYSGIKSRKIPRNVKLGKFGEMMVEMLPQDLAFTVFVPSEEALKRDLRLPVTDGLKPDEFNDTYAIITRILGFSAVPHATFSVNVPVREMVNYDSLSGYKLYISRDIDVMLVVNRIRSEIGDVKKREVVIHIIDGVIMDADFEQSVLSDDTEE